MLDRITSLFSREKSPLANAKLATQWCKQIESLDPASQCDKVHGLISDFVAAADKVSIDRLQALMLLDEQIQEAFDAVCYQYVSNPRMSKDMEQKLWKFVVSFASDMVQAYQRFVQAEHTEVQQQQFDLLMPLVLARSLRYVAVEAKWHYFRFERVPSKLWIQAHQMYRLSEVGAFDCNPFSLYPSYKKDISSCADEYIQMLMLSTLANNNLSVRQIDMVDTWLEQWSKLIQLGRKFQEDRHHFCVNLQESQGPQKINNDLIGEPYRYWGLNDLIGQIQEILGKLMTGASYASLELGVDVRGPAVGELLKHLDVFWTMCMRNSQVKRSERQKVTKAADIIYGLDRVCRYVKQDNDKFSRQGVEGKEQVDYDEIMDMRLYGFVSSRTKEKLAANPYSFTVNKKENDWQAWAVDNESADGFGAVIRFSENEWIRPSLLIGSRTSSADNWSVGILRRIARLSEDEVSVGVQIVSGTPVMVGMKSEQNDRIENITVAELGFTGGLELPNVRTALYVPHQINGSSVNTLIMHSADYGLDKIYQVNARDKKFSVSLGSVLEKGVDWTWVTVNVLRQD
ncbi:MULTISPECIES: hypothetical protein [Deefgea]|uniref:Uncharacterized protein n=1 Tax=Deefgea chitinilytica TaxID=570276 RepID=A0ABS2C8E9_9NEIS|nr:MULTISPECIES: hypothetical protein [Deefgea]MBM5570434.1 hypothetical protein [Deefgea chitinilytica]MBM9887663.1 hypothetical protein [Deefgea sp. CFH1-16]